MTMRWKDAPLRRKLMAVNLLTSGAVLLLTCAAFVTYEVVTLHKGMLDGYQTRAQIIAANSTAALAFQNPSDAADVLAALRTDPRVPEACLYDVHGKIFAKYPAAGSDGSFPAVPGGSGYRDGRLDVFCPVLQGGRMLGTVYIRSDLSALTDRYRAYAWLAALVIAGSLLLAYLLSRMLEKQISRPILALAGTAEAVSRRRDFSVRAEKYGGDELGTLTDAFNQMLEQILAQDQALRTAENNYRRAVETIEDYSILVVDPQGTVLTWNAGVEKIKGYKAGDVIGKNFSMFYTPEDLAADKPRELLKRAAEKGRIEEDGWRVR